jgi:hypothetical protein
MPADGLSRLGEADRAAAPGWTDPAAGLLGCAVHAARPLTDRTAATGAGRTGSVAACPDSVG